MMQKAAILAALLAAGTQAAASVSPAQPHAAAEVRCIPVEEALRSLGPSATRDPRHIVQVSAAEAPLSYSVHVHAGIIERGRPVDFTLSIRNVGTTPATLWFPTSQQFEVVVWNDDCTEVWRWSRGKDFAQGATSSTVQACCPVFYQIRWPRRDQAGRPVRSGAYEARVVFLGESATRHVPIVFPPLIFSLQ